MSLSHVTFLTYMYIELEIMSHGLRLKMTTPFQQNHGHSKWPHLFHHRTVYPVCDIRLLE